MSVPAALMAFPLVLRTLVEAELAAGNRIVELGHGFPAPPVGAYVKLAHTVSTQARASTDDLSFYERNGSSYSGEFTDVKRFYFVLEPAHLPQVEPDMDAIRRSLQATERAMSQRVARDAASTDERPDVREPGTSAFASSWHVRPAASASAQTTNASAAGWTRTLHFRDHRAPHDVQFAFERTLMVLFAPDIHADQLCFRATATVVGARYEFTLRLEAALPGENAYSLRVVASWHAQSAEYLEYYRATSVSWFDSWTRDLTSATPPEPGTGSPQRYRELVDDTLRAEASLDSVNAIQKVIVTAMQRGATFGDSHKEGDTTICWRDGRFIRVDVGDYPDHRVFADETEFLTALRQFCQHWITSNAGSQVVSEYDAWKLILRKLRT